MGYRTLPIYDLVCRAHHAGVPHPCCARMGHPQGWGTRAAPTIRESPTLAAQEWGTRRAHHAGVPHPCCARMGHPCKNGAPAQRPCLFGPENDKVTYSCQTGSALYIHVSQTQLCTFMSDGLSSVQANFSCFDLSGWMPNPLPIQTADNVSISVNIANLGVTVKVFYRRPNL